MALRNEKMLARYVLWANEVTYAVVADLPEATMSAPQDTMFGSILGTLGHNYAVGAIFQAHLERRAHGFTVRRMPDTTTFDELRAMQRDLDAWYVGWIDRMTECELDQSIDFQFVDGGKGVMTRGEMFFHVVNHYTFHRGFIVDTLRRISAPVPVTDLTVYLRDGV
ncbi:DinB family protein [Trinickia sp. NRRL B-1857]|uniref:DinB family protein n=1 Tax=Trinickia sp. NRRL B-1857 TaxID=3162879 RepID=UPI003D2A0B60